MGGVWGIYELLPAFIFGAAVNVIVCLLTPEPENDVLKTFDSVRR